VKRVLVCGGRDYHDAKHVWDVLDLVHAKRGVAVLIHGAARGADCIAAAWAADRSVPAEAYPADWQRDGKRAGPMRNAKMLAEGKPDVVVAFPGGRGTADMVRRAQSAGLPVWEVL
jgi:hypothetical protein